MYTRASISCSPEAPEGQRWNVHLGNWKKGEVIAGFETVEDAYVWCVETTMINPLANMPEVNTKWTKNMKSKVEKEVSGLPLFDTA